MSRSDLTGAIRSAAVGEIERLADGSIRQGYVFNADFPAFSGHFPGRPILPAVVQIMAASQLIETSTGRPLSMPSIERAKFVNPIAPGALVEITCRRLPEIAAERWEVRIEADRQAAASFFLALRAPAASA